MKGSPSPIGPVTIIAAFYMLSVYISRAGVYRTPKPLALDAAPDLFSEARTVRHVELLTADPAGRLVGHPAMEKGIRYVLDAAREVEALAADREDITVQVELQAVGGALHMLFLDNVIGNAYQNLSNIVLTIRPRELGSPKAVLVGSHYDSIIGSRGASDCASQVAVMLEAARTLVADRSVKLVSPVVFAFNGGEETFSQAAHGFMAKYDRPLGAFINLESTGPGGPDYLFQHTGGWTVAAYARSAKHPRGAVIGQDIFESGLLPADSDYRMFSSRHYGRLPGLDVAFLLDGAAYHTDRDTVDRIRTGTLQAMGDNVVAALPEFARQLQHHEMQSDSADDGSTNVFFDLYGLYMVVYTHRTARLLHSVPVALALAMPLMSGPRRRGQQVATYSAIARGAAVHATSALAGLLAPFLLAVLRVVVLGKPMIWYSQHWVAFLMYVPISVAAVLWVQAVGQRAMRLDLANALLGMAAATGGLAVMMTSLGLGSGFLPAMWAFAALIGIPAYGRELQARSLLTALAAAFIPVACSLPVALLLANVLMDKTSMIGVLPAPLGPPLVDGIIGAIVGLGTVLASSAVGIWLVSLIPRRQLRAINILLVATSVVAAVAASTRLQPYSVEAPKRVLLQHVFKQDAAGALVPEGGRLVVGGSDVNRVETLLDLSDLTRLPNSYRDWQTLYPLTSRLDGVVVQPEVSSTPPFEQLPTLRVLDSKPRANGGRRLSLQLDTGAPCWGVLNMTGGVEAWSFAEGLPHSSVGLEGEPEHCIRFAGNEGSREWTFWVDVAAGSPLRVEVVVSFWQRGTAALDKLIAERMPKWTTMLSGVSLHSQWDF